MCGDLLQVQLVQALVDGVDKLIKLEKKLEKGECVDRLI